MIEMLLASPYAVLSVLLGFVLFIALAAASLVLYERQRRNLPAVAEWVDLGERIERKRSELAVIEEKLAELRRQAGERDHLLAEIDALRTQREAVQLEYAGLADARAQIDDVKMQAAQAATELAKSQDELSELQKRREEASALQRRIEEMKAQLGGLPHELSAEIEALQTTLSNLERELDEKRAERGIVRAEAAAAEQQLLDMKRQREALLEELPNLAARATDAKGELDILKEMLRQANQATEAARAEVTQTHSDLIATRHALSGATAEVQELAARKEILHSTVTELAAKKEQLEREVESRQQLGRQDDAGAPSQQEVLGDLMRLPVVLDGGGGKPVAYAQLESEEAALQRVTQHLKSHNLEYPERVIYAFHTALKINDVSQLTVLAGVSGTGKSLLPRRYAEAMGIRFLPIAVEPRWDSPQDLLGFYNYVEKKFKATELARALVHLDPYNTSGLVSPDDKSFSNDIMIVLLDEMNLARVEYYFSEFLSRLEARPSLFSKGEQPNQRRDAEIPVDIRGRQESTVRLYPPHNMLFVGTMNDDESTQALSEKVLDRGNVMQFAAPNAFADVKNTEGSLAMERRLAFATWKGWIKPSDRMPEADRSTTKDVITKLQNIMMECGHPFGHRLHAAMTAYVANYPVGLAHGIGVNRPLADQIEFRILPKLRGLALDTEAGNTAIKRLRDLIKYDLQDELLADALEAHAERQSRGGGLFNWRGLMR